MVRSLPGGPRPIRSVQQPYGVSPLQPTAKEQTQVKLGNYFAIQTARLAQLAHQLGVSFVFENPEPSAGYPSIFLLREVAEIAALPGTQVIDFDQCRLGARSRKPTRLLAIGVDLRSIQGLRCDHPRRQWKYRDIRGAPTVKWSAHEPIAGTLGPTGAFGTAAAAAYPYELNKLIIRAVIGKGRAARPQGTAASSILGLHGARGPTGRAQAHPAGGPRRGNT